jgi:hypothetical protein
MSEPLRILPMRAQHLRPLRHISINRSPLSIADAGLQKRNRRRSAFSNISHQVSVRKIMAQSWLFAFHPLCTISKMRYFIGKNY